MKKTIVTAISLILLVYMLWPGPTQIANFNPLPNASKSKLSGDTVQVPNVMAFFSNNYRNYVVNYYSINMQTLNNLPFKPLILSYPPEFAFSAIKDQTMSTYLDEVVYPLRSSLFVNGWEPLDSNRQPRYKGADVFGVEGVQYDTKVTLRYYPSETFIRIIIWLGINLSACLLWIVGKNVIYER